MFHFGLLHRHQRKRIHELKQPFPHPDPKFRFVDNLALVVSILAPIQLIPQIYTVWIDSDISGVSLTTWVLALVFNLVMQVYAYVHRAWTLTIMWGLLGIGFLLIVIGILVNG